MAIACPQAFYRKIFRPIQTILSLVGRVQPKFITRPLHHSVSFWWYLLTIFSSIGIVQLWHTIRHLDLPFNCRLLDARTILSPVGIVLSIHLEFPQILFVYATSCTQFFFYLLASRHTEFTVFQIIFNCSVLYLH